ncbi:TATA box-binding protein-associated factor RNA polymerase I subunit C-like [Mizuhopecten yessoensis]|uniref:TATA box-binding protein-associated factor RNA polymerase I subunit C-like n=1 Tax=Mizuhopecten yessoensis TaxID=6573 RepID=UPI000B45CD28|nr:TATA box-binding protein-associated factor RNA polymerase I subunit C-like [Mizuhopecten yessoensis]XP_021362736.1 TATA box-binding protein-associated factor RNA polymerase I subunit C-like [Mizuhopecten yessoensis]XP_021362737.1 TATA box-binding protein-associated factor RNA polymerase I subunit C-like [Mizuhopecten yessoensis]
MDFPDANFPNHQTVQTTRREVFYEYGSHGYADVGSIYGQKIEAFCQKVPEGFHGKRDSLCAKRPTLPLSQRPNDVNTNRDDVMSKVFKLQKEAQNFRKLVKVYNFKNHTLSARVKRQLRLCHSSSTSNGGEELHIDIIQKLTEQYQQLRDLSDIPKTNSEYAGGCVSCLPGSRSSGSSSDCRLVSAIGETLSQLRITDIKINHEDLTLQPINHQVIEAAPVREVTTRCVLGKEHIAVRGLTGCMLYSVGRGASDVTLVGKEDFSTEQGRPTSVCLSGYIPGDCLVSMTTGAVYLWSPGNRQKQVINDRSTRFKCTLPWRRAEFGAHPREVIASDPTVVQLFDIRRSPTKQGVDLFALPSPLVLPGERIHVSTQSTVSEFYHFVACDYNFFLLDQRFPGTPVLSWKHMLVNPPQYLGGVNFPSKGHSLLLMASQSPPEVCCYKYNCSSGMAAQALGAPWRVSRIDDIFHHGSVCGGTAGVMVSERFNTSLIGVAAVPLDDGFFAVQVDSYGEVFYQGYNFTNTGGDKTCSMETDNQSWDDITIGKGRRWISRYIKHREKNKDKNCKEILRQPENNFDKEITLVKQPHISCPLCHPEIESIDNDTDICPACHQSLTTGQQLVQAGKGLVGYWPGDIKLWGEQLKSKGNQVRETQRTEEKESFPRTNALSKILVSLWEEESPDLTQLLQQRDEETRKKKEARQKKRKEKSSYLMDGDQQLIRSLQQAVDGGSRQQSRESSESRQRSPPPGGTVSRQRSPPPGGTVSRNGSPQPGGSRDDNLVSPSWIDNRGTGSDGEDSDASFHRLFGIDISTMREDDDQQKAGADSSAITQSWGLANIQETPYQENRSFTNLHSSRKRKRLTSESLFSDDQSEDAAKQPTADREAFSLDRSYRVTQTTNGDTIGNEDNWDSQFFSQDIAQSFTMFSGSFVLPSPATPTPSDPHLSFTSKPKQLRLTASPNTDWKSHKKKGRLSIGGF